MDLHLIHQTISDLVNRPKQGSQRNDKLINELRDGGIEIINSQLERKNVVVWIWCRSQTALENIQNLHVSNRLSDILFDVANIRSSPSEIIQSKVISIDSNEFKKTVGKFL